MDTNTIWSYGGGVQTIAILCLIAKGKLPHPALAVMADTGRERSTTWQYLDEYARPLMDEMGLPFHVAEHNLATVDLYSHRGKLLIPAFTQSGKLPTFCSNEWKRRVVERHLRSLGYGPKCPVQMWLGMSLDEIERMKHSPTSWIDHRYPLIEDVRLRRIECETIIERFGLPVPPKSACWMCPHLNNDEWQEIKKQSPDNFSQAIELEQTASDADKRGGVYLHRSLTPLADIDFDSLDEQAPTLFDGCDSGFCFV